MKLYFHSSETDGAEGAKRKAWLLNRESGYNILAIEHRSLAPIGVFPDRTPTIWGRTELGYKITAEKPLPHLYTRVIPSIIEA